MIEAEGLGRLTRGNFLCEILLSGRGVAARSEEPGDMFKIGRCRPILSVELEIS